MGGSASISLSQNATGVQVAWDGTINTFSFGTTPSCDGRSVSTIASTINQVSFANGFRLETDGEVYAKNQYILPNTDLYQVIDYDLNGCGSGSFPLENIIGGDVMFGFKLNNNLGLIVYAPSNINSTSVDPLTTISGSAMIPDVTLDDLGLSPELSCFITYVACSGESGYAGGPLSEKIAMVVAWPDDGNNTDPDDPPADDGNVDDNSSCGFLDFSNFCPLVWTSSFVSALITYLVNLL